MSADNISLEGDNIPQEIEELVSQNIADNESEASEEENILPDSIAPPVHTTRSGRTTRAPKWANDYVFNYL